MLVLVIDASFHHRSHIALVAGSTSRQAQISSEDGEPARDRARAPLYLAWALLFTYFLFDDSRELHDIMGHALVSKLGMNGVFGSRAQEFGELAAYAFCSA
jgi:hypothetical protein